MSKQIHQSHTKHTSASTPGNMAAMHFQEQLNQVGANQRDPTRHTCRANISAQVIVSGGLWSFQPQTWEMTAPYYP